LRRGQKLLLRNLDIEAGSIEAVGPAATVTAAA
jgi:hypothetical protein